MIDKTIEKINPTEKNDNNLYKLMNEETIKVINDINLFKKYLDKQSTFDKYSVGNTLLILSQAPNSKQLNKTKQSLKDIEVSLIQPNKNSNFKNYKLFSSERKAKPNKYYEDNKLLLKGFLYMCPVDIKVVGELENEKNVFWNNEMKLLYIKKGCEYKDLFEGLARELTKEELGSKNTELEKFKCECISYMILKKYNLDVSNYNFNKIPKEFIKTNPKDIRKELNELREGLNIFSNRVNSFFNDLYKTNIRKTKYKGR